jgi:hypothetical protein
VLVAAVIYLIVRRTRGRPSEPGADETTTGSGVGGTGTAVDAVPD